MAELANLKHEHFARRVSAARAALRPIGWRTEKMLRGLTRPRVGFKRGPKLKSGLTSFARNSRSETSWIGTRLSKITRLFFRKVWKTRNVAA